MNKYLYKIKDLEVPPWLKYWFARKSKVNFDLSQILNGSSFDLTDTVNKKLHLINIFGNSIQNGEPTPENPIEIKSTGDNGYIVEKFVNKNLFDKENINSFNTYIGTVSHVISTNINEKFRTIYVKLINGKTYTVSKSAGGSLILGTTAEVPTLGMELNNFSNYSNLTDGKYGTITLTGNDKYLVAYIYSSADYDRGLDIQEIYNSLQIEEGSVATDYEPHQLQTYTIPCQQPMRAIGDVKDKFVNIKGVWYERHNIGEFILNGSENWNRTETKTNGNYYFFCDNVLNNILYTNNKFAGISNIGITTSVYQEIQGVDTIYYDSKNRTRIYTEITKAMTVTEFKDWLTLNNVKIIYVLLTPIDLPCTQAQITALESLMKARTYKDVTHIYTDDEVPADLQIQYYKEKGE